MVDPLSFPVLAGSALTGAITFLYARVGAVLDRRAGRVPPDEPDLVEGWPTPLRPDVDALDQQSMQRLERHNRLLCHYHSEYNVGDSGLCGDDPQLRQLLAAVRRDLEAIYRVSFAFGEEQRTGPTVRVEQSSVQVAGRQQGIAARGVGPDASLTVIQDTGIVHADADQTGVQIDGMIG